MKRGMTAVVTTLILAAGLSAQSTATGAKALDGRWRIATINGGDPAAMAGGEMVLAFAEGKYQQFIAGTLAEEGTITVDASKSPALIDLSIGTGADAGKAQRGLFEVKGDNLTMTLSLPEENPARTASLTEGALVVSATRVKPGAGL